MPPCLSLRDWYESGKSSHSDQAYRLPYLTTPVSPFRAEPLHPSVAAGLRVSSPDRYQLTETLGFRTGPRHAEKLVPSETVTDMQRAKEVPRVDSKARATVITGVIVKLGSDATGPPCENLIKDDLQAHLNLAGRLGRAANG
jgi:hypothetical protein